MRRETRIAIGVLVGWNLLLYHRVLLLGEVPDGGDLNYLHYPWKTFFLHSVREGVFPFWNPYPFCGTPFFHDIQTCTLYPPDWIYFFVSLPWGFGVSYFLHNLAAGLFFYGLAGRFLENPRAKLLAAVVYAGSGALVSRLFLGNAVVIASYAWAPLFFYCAIRGFGNPTARRIGAFALVSAIFILAGHPQFPFLTVQLLFAYLLFRTVTERNWAEAGKGWIALGIGGSLGLAVTLVQVGPFLEWIGYSATRAGGASYEFAAEGSMPFSNLLALFMPLFYGDPANETYWGSPIPYPEICGYLGTISVFLILAAALLSRKKETWFWLAVAVGSILLALGEFTPLHRIFYSLVPGWDLFRQPGRSLFLFTFAGSLLAGYGFQSLDMGEEQTKSRSFTLLGFFSGLSVVLLASGFLYLATHKESILDQFAERENLKASARTGSQDRPYVSGNFAHRYEAMERSVLLALVFSSGLAGSLIGWRMRPRKREQIAWGLILLTAIDLYQFGHRFLVTRPEDEWRDLRHRESALAGDLARESDEGRLLQPDTALDYRFRERHPEFYPNGPMAQGIRTVRGYSATILDHYNRFIDTIQGRDQEEPPGGLLILDRIDTADRFGLAAANVRWMVDYRPHTGPFEVVEKGRDGLYLHELKGALSRCFRAVEAENRWGTSPVERSEDDTEIVESTPNRVVVRTRGGRPADLVFSECRFPGWKAKVDGREVPIEEALIAFQKVPVPGGTSQVVWEFRPTRFGLYLFVSALAACVSLLLVFLPSRSRDSRTLSTCR